MEQNQMIKEQTLGKKGSNEGYPPHTNT